MSAKGLLGMVRKMLLKYRCSQEPRQCLNRRIPTQEKLVQEVKPWERARNEATIRRDWQFTTSDAKIKLKKLYPTI